MYVLRCSLDLSRTFTEFVSPLGFHWSHDASWLRTNPIDEWILIFDLPTFSISESWVNICFYLGQEDGDWVSNLSIVANGKKLGPIRPLVHVLSFWRVLRAEVWVGTTNTKQTNIEIHILEMPNLVFLIIWTFGRVNFFSFIPILFFFKSIFFCVSYCSKIVNISSQWSNWPLYILQKYHITIVSKFELGYQVRFSICLRFQHFCVYPLKIHFALLF